MVLRVGLLGLGMMGRHHARVLRDLEGVELVAIADSSGDPNRVAGSLEVLQDVDALVAAGIDYAVVAVPTQSHEEVALELAAAGVHALVEKPIAHTLEAGRRMVDAFDAAGLVGAVGHVERYNPALQELRRRIERGQLGEVYQITTSRQGPYPGRISDVGVGKDLASHDIDLTAWVADSPYERVAAQTTLRAGRPHEDMIAITGRLANGIIVNHLVNWLSPRKERVTIVTGERGAFVADTNAGDLTFYENGHIATEWSAVSQFRGVAEGDATRYALDRREPLRVEHEAMRDAILGVRQEAVMLVEGLAALQVVEAALESARSGSTVQL